MIKKTIIYNDFDGVEVSEDFYFNLTSAELTETELVYPGGFANHLQKIVDNDDRPEIIKAFKDLILSSVGVKGEDNKSFNKKGVADNFVSTEAFSVLFMELMTDSAKSAEFFNGVMPKDLAEKVAALTAGANVKTDAVKEKKFPDDYHEFELLEMPRPEFDRLMKTIPGKNIPRDLLLLALRRTEK